MKKTRRILSVMTAVTCLTSAVSMTANATLFSDPADYETAFTYEKLDTDEDGTYDFIRIKKGSPLATEVNIPAEIEGLPVTHIFDGAFNGIDSLRSINLSETITNIGYMGLFNTSLEEINVAEGNAEFSSADGVLYDKDKTAIYQYPSSKAGTEYTVPDSVTAIMGNAFSDCKNLKDITISENVNYIGNEAFIRCSSLESITFENSDCQFNEMFETITNGFVDGKGYFNGIIYGYENSTAQAYAEKHDYNFAVIGTEPETTKPVVTTQAVTSQNVAVTTTVNIVCENCGEVILSQDDVVVTPLGMKLCEDCGKLGIGGTTAAPYRPETTETTVSSENLITDADLILQMISGFIADADLAARAYIDNIMPDSVTLEIQEYWNQEEIRTQIKDYIAEKNIDPGKIIFIVLETGATEVPTDLIEWDKVLYGDNNCDSDISIADTIVLSKYVLNADLFPLKSATAKENADCAYDLSVDSKDISQLLEYNTGGIGIMDMGPADKTHCKMYYN